MFLSLETKHQIKPVRQSGTKLSTVLLLKRCVLPSQHAAVNPLIHVNPGVFLPPAHTVKTQSETAQNT